DRSDGGTVGALEPERERDEPAARGADLIEVGQVLDDRDADGEEEGVGRVLVAGRLAARRGDAVADAEIRWVVVPDGLDAALDQPPAAALPGERPLAPEAGAVHALLPRPIGPQQRDVDGLHVPAALLQCLGGDLAVGA